MSDTTLNPAYLRDQARRCRRLADAIADEKARKTLIALAAEYEQRALAEDPMDCTPLDCDTA